VGRELRGLFLSPLAWVVLTLFLLVQGYAFYVLLELCNHPKGPPGPVLNYFFGGSFFYWLFVIAVISLLTMRTLAGERRLGTLEILLAAPVGAAQVVLGKFLAVCLFYVFLWAPTLCHVMLAASLGGEADVGVVASGYLGTLALGAAALSVGVLCSSLTRSQLLSGIATFAVLGSFLQLGPLKLFVQAAWLRQLAGALDLFQQMEDFSRGLVDSRALLLYGSVALFCITCAVLALRAPRRRRQRLRLLLGVGLLLLNLVLINLLGARHHARWDWTAGGTYTLSPRTVQVLRTMARPVKAYLFMVPPDRLQPSMYPRVKEVLHRFAKRSGGAFTVERVDIDAAPTRAEVLARRFGVSGDDLRRGVVVLSGGERTRLVTSSQMATGVDHSVSPPRVLGFRGEAALLTALRGLLDPRPRVLCFSQGHGEALVDSYDQKGYGIIADEARRDGYTVRALGPAGLLGTATGKGGGLDSCRVLVIGGPRRAFAPAEVHALEKFLRGGGRLFLLMGPVLDRRVTRHGVVGVESLMARWGVALPHKILVDKMQVPGEQPLLTWGTRDGYADHPAVRAVAGRITVWPLSREVRPLPGTMAGLKAAPLIVTSAEGWAEADLASLRGDRPLTLDRALDSPGPAAVAVAVQWRSTRIVVFGCERGLLNRRQSGQRVKDHNRELFLAAVSWLAGDDKLGALPGPPAGQSARSILDRAQLHKVFLLVVVLLPLCALGLALLVWWRRRR